VSLHLPLTTTTHHLLSRAQFDRMKPGALVINSARGGIVSDRDLLAALDSGRLGGAGLDVFESEADPSLKRVTARLIAHPHVIATPHCVGGRIESISRTNQMAADCVIRLLSGLRPDADRIIVDGLAAAGAT
jgi:D-3-phosphoglycerate dehydrogenase